MAGAVDNAGVGMMKKKRKKTGRSSVKSGDWSERQPPHSRPLEERASPFTPEELENLRQALLEKRRELLDDVGSLRNEATCKNSLGESTSSSSMPIHMAERGSDTWEQEFTYRLLENKEALLREIDDALQRIQNNTYGFAPAGIIPMGITRPMALTRKLADCIHQVLRCSNGVAEGDSTRARHAAPRPRSLALERVQRLDPPHGCFQDRCRR